MSTRDRWSLLSVLPRSASLFALVTANLIPLAGLLFFDWDIAVIAVLYWAENLIVGGYTILRMTLVRSPIGAAHLGKMFAIPFFLLHFGGFCAVHGLFLIALLKIGGDLHSVFSSIGGAGPFVFLQLLAAVVRRLWETRPPGFVWPLLGLVISHGISLVQNDILGNGLESETIAHLMTRPYRRIAVLHVAILLGGMAIMTYDSPLPLLVLLVVLKIGLDVWLHLREHRPRTPSARPTTR